MPKVTNETGNPLKVIVAYKITVLEPVHIHGEMKVDINEGSGGPISLSSDEVTWVLQYGEPSTLSVTTPMTLSSRRSSMKRCSVNPPLPVIGRREKSTQMSTFILSGSDIGKSRTTKAAVPTIRSYRVDLPARESPARLR